MRRRKPNRLEEAEFFKLYLSELPSDRPLRVLVTGARTWTALEPVRAQLQRLQPGSIIIHGAARGADTIAGDIAAELRLGVIPCPANWKLGRGAGIMRNRQMLEEHHPDIVLAVHPCLLEARGTKHMVDLALKARLPVCLVGALRQGEPTPVS